MGPVYNDMVRFFLMDEWKFTPLEGKPILQMGFSGRNGNWTCVAHAHDEKKQVVFLSICSIKVPEAKRHRVAEFLTRANYGLIIGNFEMDYEDGEIRYKTSVALGDDRVPPDIMKPLVYINVAMMDRYLPGIMAVAHGNISPEDAIREIEG